MAMRASTPILQAVRWSAPNPVARRRARRGRDRRRDVDALDEHPEMHNTASEVRAAISRIDPRILASDLGTERPVSNSPARWSPPKGETLTERMIWASRG
jgi:hypothetical protein